MKLIWIFIAIGGAIGSYIPILLGADDFSGWSIISGVIGSLFGIWLYKKLDLE